MSTVRVNIPGRVASFSEGGEAFIAWSDERDGKPRNENEYDPGEWAYFDAVADGRIVRPSKGGYYVIARLTPAAVEAARYWAETLATASGDDAAYDPEARNDHRAALKLLARLPYTA